MDSNSQKGSILIALVIAMTLMSALGAGIYTMTSSSTVSELLVTRDYNAYHLAKAGVRYAGLNRDTIADPSDSKYCMNDGHCFNITRNGDKFTVLGSLNEGTFLASSRMLVCNISSSIPPTHTPASTKVLYSSNSIDIINQGFVDGSVHGLDVKLKNQVEVTGDVTATGNVEMINQSIVRGKICANGNVTLENQTFVAGDIHAHGDVLLISNSEVGGNIYATGDVTLQHGAKVLGNIHAGGVVKLVSQNTVYGNVVANGNIELANHSEIKGNATAGGTVTLVSKNIVHGNVFANGDIVLANGSQIKGDATANGSITLGWQTTINGTATQNAQNPVPNPTPPDICDVICMPDHAVFTSGTTDVSVSWNTDRTLSPGSYKKLNLSGQNKLYLTGGDYYFSEIWTGTKPSLYLDLSGDDISIFVEGNVLFGDQLDIYVKNNVTYESITQGNNLKEALRHLAAKVYIETLNDFTMSNQNEWFGTIYAKNKITFDNQNLLVGSYHASGQVTTANQMKVYFVESNYARDKWEYSCP